MRTLPAALLLLLPVAPTFAQEVKTPSEHLGRPLGADFELADWSEVSSYYRHLAETSPNVVLRTLGSTTEGRDFLLAIVSAPENLARLDEIRAHNRVLSDPRGRTDEETETALRDGRTTLFVSPGMHSTETSPAQFAMEFAHRLATSEEEPWADARRELVVGVFPCTNPDGLDHVVSWYRRFVGTPYEATALDRLYQLYAGHDNNRDWFMLSLAETRLVTEQLYRVWRPQVYWDVHEQGRTRERFFVPPFRDPLNPNIDPGVITGIDVLGSRALMDMTRAELTGISTGVSYDMWWNGGNRSVPARHNVIGLLTEAASVRFASPVFLPRGELAAPRGLGGYAPSNRFPAPWPGGWWRLRDVIDYELEFGMSLVGSLAREARLWRKNSLELSRRALARGRDEGPRAWLVPPTSNPDRSAVRRLLLALEWGGVELSTADAEFEADGRTWPAGTVVVPRDQPYGNHVKDLFEVQRYPEGDPPYDVAGWTLPLLLGVHRVEVMGELEVALTRAANVNQALAAFAGDERVAMAPYLGQMDARDGDTWPALARRLAQGEATTWIGAGPRAGLFVPGETGLPEEAPTVLTSLPRIGLYSPWSGSMPEGWMRWALDTFQVPYVVVRNESLRAGALAEWLDVLVLAGSSSGQLDRGRSTGSVPAELAGGLAPEGAVAIEEFVRGGGRVVAVGASSAWVASLLRLPLADAAAEDDEFSCPGSVVRTIPADDARAAGLPASVPVFFSRSAAWRVLAGDEAREAGLDPDVEVTPLARYAPTRVLLSGWIRAPEAVEGRVAWLRAEHGDGAVHLFGFQPQYRSWSQGAFHLLFRALFLG